MEVAQAPVGYTRIRGSPSSVHLDLNLQSPCDDEHSDNTAYLSFGAQDAQTIQFPRHRHFRRRNAVLPFNPPVHSNSTYETSPPPASQQQVLPLTD